jgi:PPM family protein phosphatase
LKVKSAVRTDVGLVREGNEDSYLVRPPLYVVADGMGGHLAGDIASATAVEKIENSITADPPRTEQALIALVRSANAEVFERARKDSSMSGMGTTCTLLLVDGETGHIAHVGDSRAYIYHDGRLQQVTEDHTLVNRMVQEGRLSAESAVHHPQRNVITRALGIEENVDVDTFTLDLNEGDRLLLCSDGLSSMVPPEDIESVLQTERDPDAAAGRLIDLANESGGEDNITVIIVDITPDGVAAEPADASASQAAPPPPPPPATGAVEATPARSTGWRRRVVIALVVLVVLLGGAYGAARYALANSWFVGATDEGTVAIYQGIPDEIAGFSFKEVEEESTVVLEDLPISFQENVTTGIKADSLEDARTIVANLEQRALEQRSIDQGGTSTNGKDG